MKPGVAALVLAREGGRCALCGLMINTGGHLHHRKPRGMGGSKLLDTPDNLLHLHPNCHLVHVEQERARAYANGWLVHRADVPSDVPVLYMVDRWVMLHHNGGLHDCTVKEAGEG